MDSEKVIKEFADYYQNFKAHCIGDIEDHAMLKDVLALLKEQQNQIWEFQDQVEYLTDKQKEQETTDTNDLRVFHCKKCGYGIEDIFISDECSYSLVPKFCPNCGRSVNNWIVMIEQEGR